MIYDSTNRRPLTADLQVPRPGSYTPAERPVGLEADPLALRDNARRYGNASAVPPARVYRYSNDTAQVGGTPDHISRRRQLVGRLIDAHRELAHQWADVASRAHGQAAAADPLNAADLTEAGLLAEGLSAWHLARRQEAQNEMNRIYVGRSSREGGI